MALQNSQTQKTDQNSQSYQKKRGCALNSWTPDHAPQLFTTYDAGYQCLSFCSQFCDHKSKQCPHNSLTKKWITFRVLSVFLVCWWCRGVGYPTSDWQDNWSFCVEGPQNMVFVRPSSVRLSVCPSVRLSRFSIGSAFGEKNEETFLFRAKPMKKWRLAWFDSRSQFDVIDCNYINIANH